MSRRYPALLIDDMLDCVARIDCYRNTLSVEDLLLSELHKDAIIRNLEVLGEAANQLKPRIHELAPDIPWRQLIGLRNRLIHEYHGVNWKVVMPVILEEMPLLKTKLEALKQLVPNSID